MNFERGDMSKGPQVPTKIVSTRSMGKGPMTAIAELEPREDGFAPWVSILWDDDYTEPVRIVAYSIVGFEGDRAISSIDEDGATQVAVTAMNAMYPILVNAAEEARIKAG